jgi:Tfp pilus assembly protein PilO
VNVSIDRELLAQIIIIVGVCVGGWLMLVQPRIAELRELEADIATAGSAASVDAEAVVRMADSLQRDIYAKVAAIESRNALARNSSRLYARITALADEHGVVVQRLNPGLAKHGVAFDGPYRATTFDVIVAGDYVRIAAFIDAIGSLPGFIRPSNLSIAPRDIDGEQLVEARLACDALEFRMPESLAALTGARHDDG